MVEYSVQVLPKKLMGVERAFNAWAKQGWRVVSVFRLDSGLLVATIETEIKADCRRCQDKGWTMITMKTEPCVDCQQAEQESKEG